MGRRDSATRSSRGRRARRAVLVPLAGLATCLPLAAAAPASGQPSPVAPSLAARLAGADASVPVLVTLRDQVRGAEHAGRPAELIRALKTAARDSQPALLGHVAAPARRLWLVNAVALRGRPAEIRRLARDPAVARIELDRPVRLFAPTGVVRGPFGRGGWGLAASGASAVWRDYGLDGSGVRVGSIDSGVDADHPDLAGKVVGWKDFVDGRPEPYDDFGHGTHTIGTIVGGSAGGAPVGVAPGARVVVAKALDGDGAATPSTLLAAAQWIADPDGNPLTHDAPSVVNCSWGDRPGPGGEALRQVIRRWRELGIVPVFSAGNDGAERSVRVPAAYPESFAVGALGPRGRVAAFSNRGALGEQTSLKPDLAAPGLHIVSAVPGGGWASLSGTSMAAPHVTGAVALLRQADPGLSVNAVEAILGTTARDAAQPGPDRRSGAGALDARAAVAAVLGPRAPRPGFSLIALPSALTNRAALTFAVEGGDAPLRVWLDGARTRHRRSGPILSVPVTTPGRHTVAIAALGPDGAVRWTPRRFSVTIDRTPPRLRLVVRRRGLLEIDYRARATDAVAGVVDRSLRSRLSDGGDRRGGPAGQHAFDGPGPYWVEAQVADRAGNLARVRRALSWPHALVARRLAWNGALSTLQVPFSVARGQRRLAGRYRTTPGLVRLLAANWEWTPFAAITNPSARPPRGAIGVWSDGHSRLVLSLEKAGRRYFLEDRDGQVRRGVLSAPRMQLGDGREGGSGR